MKMNINSTYQAFHYSIIALLALHLSSGYTQSVQIELGGAMNIHHEGENVPEPGTMRWSECDYEVWNGSHWISLTKGAAITRYAESAGGDLADLGSAVTSDLNGNIYITGFITESAIFKTENILGNGSQDIFLASYDKNGNFQWAVAAGGTLSDQGNHVQTDNQGNVYVTGQFQDTAYFETTALISTGEFDIFLAKYDNLGNLVWVVQAGGVSSEEGTSISCKNQDIYLTGKFQETAYFDSDSIVSNGDSDIFLAKYNTNGSLQWIKKAGGVSFDGGSSLTEDDSNNIYLTGYYRGTATFESIVVPGNGSNNIFLAKYDTNGSPLWVKSAGGTGNDIGECVTVDLNQDIYVTGIFSSTANFDTETLESIGGTDMFVAKYSTSGSLIWIKHAGGSDSDIVAGIGTDVYGDIYITGYFQDSFEIENNLLISRGDRDIFIIKMNTAGSLIWLKHQGSELSDISASLAIDPNQKLYITGFFQSETKIGLTFLESNGFSDIFLAKFDP